MVLLAQRGKVARHFIVGSQLCLSIASLARQQGYGTGIKAQGWMDDCFNASSQGTQTAGERVSSS